MESSIHISPGSKVRNNQRKNQEEEELSIVQARQLIAYKVLIWFSNGKQRIIDFEPLFLRFVKGQYSSWFSPEKFKKFLIKNGNIYWGKNEDVIFPVSFLYNSKFGVTQKEEVLYVI
ncbi:MAG TPA: hypothetical protein VF540_10675 [Segetibacter sp.]|jgi:hypothetical protein